MSALTTCMSSILTITRTGPQKETYWLHRQETWTEMAANFERMSWREVDMKNCWQTLQRAALQQDGWLLCRAEVKTGSGHLRDTGWERVTKGELTRGDLLTHTAASLRRRTNTETAFPACKVPETALHIFSTNCERHSQGGSLNTFKPLCAERECVLVHATLYILVLLYICTIVYYIYSHAID